MPHKNIVTFCLVASALALGGSSAAHAEGPAAPDAQPGEPGGDQSVQLRLLLLRVRPADR